MRDQDALADVVVLTVKAALAPILSDVKALQAQIAGMDARWNDVGALRERVAVVESKSVAPVETEPFDLSPLLERMAVTEAKLAALPTYEPVLTELRDRVVTIETKSSVTAPVVLPEPVDLSPLLERIASTEARITVLGDVRDRVAIVETKSAMPIAEPVTVDLSPVLASIADLTKEQSALRERLAVAEVRQLVPGPAGEDGKDGIDGKDGKDGLNGKDGADGLGWDDLAVEQVDESTFTVKCARGIQVKELGTLTFPVDIYKGVYNEATTYKRGHCVTWGGSEWHANETTTTKPGDGSKAWTLKVKRGRDGRDGKDAETAPPVVSIGRR